MKILRCICTSTAVFSAAVYERTGAVSAVYGTAAFAGVEKILRLVAKRDDLILHPGALEQRLLERKNPPPIRLNVNGALPAPK